MTFLTELLVKFWNYFTEMFLICISTKFAQNVSSSLNKMPTRAKKRNELSDISPWNAGQISKYCFLITSLPNLSKGFRFVEQNGYQS